MTAEERAAANVPSPTDKLAKTIEDALRLRIRHALEKAYRELDTALLAIPGGAETYDKTKVQSVAVDNVGGYNSRELLNKVLNAQMHRFTTAALPAEIDSFVSRVNALAKP